MYLTKVIHSFAYTDYALALASGSRELNGVDLNASYDSACSWEVKAGERFTRTELSHVKELVNRTRFSIDSLHINDHLDKCMYLLGACYQPGTGHFHGVGTEQFWSENNQMGNQTRQMNPGHRHDKISEHYSDWNWKKLIRLGE